MTDDLFQRAFIVDESVMARYKKSLRKRNVKGGQQEAVKQPRIPGQKSVSGPKRRSLSAIRDCNTCQLFTQCKTPKMEPFGQGRMKIAIVGESPGEAEDQQGRPFVGKSGQLLRDTLDDLGVDLDADCLLTNAFQCRPPKDKKAAKMKIWADCCQSRLEKQLLDFQPQLILALGADAMRAVLRPSFDTPTAFRYRGLCFPSRKYTSWVGCTFHPSFIIRTADKEVKTLRSIFVDDLAQALSIVESGRVVPPLLADNEYSILSSVEDVRYFFDEFKKLKTPVAFDYETNGFLPYRKSAKIYCATFADSRYHGYFLPLQFKHYWNDEQFDVVADEFTSWLRSSCPKVVQNLSMEERWTSELFGTEIQNVVSDTMVTHHCIYNREKTSGLDFQTFLYTGVDYKSMVNMEQDDWAEKEPEKNVQLYSTLDARNTILVHEEQQEILKRNPGLKRGAEFFNKCYPALIRMEKRGIQTDVQLLKKLETDSVTQQKECESFFEASPFTEQFKQKTGRSKWGPGSDKDFIDMFYKTLGVEPPSWTTKGGNLPADGAAVTFIVENVQDTALSEFCQKMMLWRRLDTLLSTFIGGFQRLIQDDGLIHPSFMLHTVASYRSSSADPNFQNLPNRNEAHAEFRKVVIPHMGDDFICECDAAGSEVRAIAMLSGDPVLGKQVKEGFDPHGYWASRLFEISQDKVTKQQRFLGKNKMVFPLFYGSYYGAVARDCKVSERHAKRTEQEFWDMYKVVKKWQESIINAYNRHGYIEMPLGFRRHRPLSKNQILNTTVQGTSFHMLLDSIRVADESVRKKKMKSSLVVEVHDSIVGSGRSEEKEDLYKILVKAMTMKQFSWQGDIPRGCELLSGPNWGEQKGVDVSPYM